MNLIKQMSEAEEKRKTYITQLRSAAKNGDIAKVQEITGLSQSNVSHALKRIHSKHHNLVVQTLENVIAERISKLSN